MGDHSTSKPSGQIIIMSEGGQWECDTKQCVHCQYTWAVTFGSGRKRGFCQSCNGPTCGRTQCIPCCPAEKQLEQMEKKFGDLTIG